MENGAVKYEIKKSKYDQLVNAVKEIAAMQGEGCPPEYTMFSFEAFDATNWVDGINGCDFVGKMDFYLPAMLLYTLKDDDGNYLYTPYVRQQDDEEDADEVMQKARAQIQKMLDKYLCVIR